MLSTVWTTKILLYFFLLPWLRLLHQFAEILLYYFLPSTLISPPAHCLIVFSSIVLRTGSDQEVGPWKPGTGIKTSFLSIKNRIYVAIPWIVKTGVGPHEPVARTVWSNPLEHSHQLSKKKCHFDTPKTHFIILVHHFTTYHLLDVLYFNSIH